MDFMSFIDIFNAIGIAALIGGFIYIGRKLQILDDLKVTVDTLKMNLKVVTDFLTRNHRNFDPSELKAFSPITLTEEGLELLKEIGFIEAFETHKEDFFSYIDSEKPKLKYDVETGAIQSIYVLNDKEYMNPLKSYSYNNPERNIGNLAPTLGVYVRDKYLAEHPEITN